MPRHVLLCEIACQLVGVKVHMRVRSEYLNLITELTEIE